MRVGVSPQSRRGAETATEKRKAKNEEEQREAGAKVPALFLSVEITSLCLRGETTKRIAASRDQYPLLAPPPPDRPPPKLLDPEEDEPDDELDSSCGSTLVYSLRKVQNAH